MSELWYPGAVTSEQFPGCGGFVFGPPRIVLHSTEGSTAEGALQTYKATGNYSHFTVDSSRVFQHCAINVGSTALQHPAGTIDTNKASAVQIEIVGVAKNAPIFSGALLANVARLLRWIEVQTGTPAVHADFTGPRFSAGQWQSFSGTCGHMHVPNNDHTDPGNINVAALFPSAPKDVVMPDFSPAIVVEPVVSALACPSGGAWTLAASGAVDAWECAYKGGANNQPYFAGRKAAKLVYANQQETAAGKTYTIIDTAGERYSY